MDPPRARTKRTTEVGLIGAELSMQHGNSDREVVKVTRLSRPGRDWLRTEDCPSTMPPFVNSRRRACGEVGTEPDLRSEALPHPVR
jgi:hypothetical protein